jgi:hypothetical protein
MIKNDWKIIGNVEWTSLSKWHPAFCRHWWVGGQIGKYADGGYTIGVRLCGLFFVCWLYMVNKQ